MAFVAADLDALNAAIASGTLSVRFADGRTVTYQGIDGLMRARGLVAAELNAASAAPVNRSSFAEFTRG